MRSRNTLVAVLVLTAALRAEPLPTDPVAADAPPKVLHPIDPIPLDGIRYDLPVLIDDPSSWPTRDHTWGDVPYDPNNPDVVYYTMRNDVALPPEVPEPASLVLAGLALGAVALRRRRMGV